MVRDCHVESIALTGGTGHVVRGNVIAGGAVSVLGASACDVRANYQHGLRWGVGIMVAGGKDHVVRENECRDDLCAIRVVGTAGARIDHNRIEARWWGIHVLDARDTVVQSNQVRHVMRAVGVEGSGAAGNLVDRLLVESCDSGVVIERGADATRIVSSWLHDCRIGMLVWEAGTVEVTDLAISEPRDHAVVTDHALELSGAQLGGDVWPAP
jgi:hypothetical protein